ncbi:hypothetical protein Pla108_02490 [Botrimarina colliarenosi]|uniref:ABM domain-containing protein n=1 Tax=Botrimarina colliarenosi TaxID=2528001 RepID=A0A5C6AH46_9BACT|nr:antibiotic biosynthesis monooxygenase [Botrimarina colliarenosi]TWT99314.1 hypothetical protein Pla108_02490 [Botrimarina colliarenosi]
MERVHVAITRHVKPGCEAEFDRASRAFAIESSHDPGEAGVQLIGPLPGSTRGEYGILRTFDNREACDAFYASDRFAEFQESVAHLVEGDGVRRELTGLEAFFRGFGAPPPRWKMAIVTWIGVYPTVLLWTWLLAKPLAGAPYLLKAAVTITLAVVTLTWGVMPLLTRVLAPWIHAGREGRRG